jgi:5'-nucleotidase
MKILLTNDDGVDADGLACLGKALDGELYVVAPAAQVSECGHRVTTREPLRFRQLGDRTWAVHGSPADCVRVAVRYLYPDVSFDWVLSGVNHGGNLGVDIYYSGTVAAAREAAILGCPSMAFSHYVKKSLSMDWNLASMRVREVWSSLSVQPLDVGWFWNVNLPHLQDTEKAPKLRYCEPCKHPLPVAYKGEVGSVRYAGEYPSRTKRSGSDTDLCFGGSMTASRIKI